MNEFVWNCPLCHSDTKHHDYFARVIGKLWVNNYIPVPVLYAICDQCGLVFQWYRMNENELYHYYAGQYRATVQGGNDGVTERVLKEQTLRVKFLMPEIDLEEVKNHLDIGASTGLFMEAMREKYGCETLGIEPAEKFRMWAKKKDLKMLSDIELLHQDYLNRFDLITAIHVLEHFPAPDELLIHLHDYITDDGQLLIEVPSLYYEHSLNISHPVAFTPDTLENLLNRTGWEIVWKKEYSGFKTERPKPANILVLAKPGQLLEHGVYVELEDIRQKYQEAQQELIEHEQNWQPPKRVAQLYKGKGEPGGKN